MKGWLAIAVGMMAMLTCIEHPATPTADACFICLRESKPSPRCTQYDAPRQCCCAVLEPGHVVCADGNCTAAGAWLLRCPYDHQDGVCRTGVGDFKCKMESDTCP